MTTIWPNHRAKDRSANIARSAALWVCLFLLGLLTLAQVAHVHKDAADADHCTICVVLHTVAPVVIAAVAILFVRAQWVVPVPATLVAHSRQARTEFIRPPPTDL